MSRFVRTVDLEFVNLEMMEFLDLRHRPNGDIAVYANTFDREYQLALFNNMDEAKDYLANSLGIMGVYGN
jgi:hypothetical protein